MGVIHLTDSTFKDEIKDYDGVALVDFWAPWCGPCQIVGPIIDELAQEYEGKVKVGKVNVDEEGTLAQEYGILSIPSVFIFKNGEVVEKITQMESKETYKEAVEKYI
ncbi:MAG TPA: thioredoxin [Candidatus Dojkabacteria bacterium]|nr:thioredoxin [Candidatus Dojkabacteria bacterium]